MGNRRIAGVVVLAIVVAVAACSTPAGRSPGQVIDDATITTKVKAKLYKDDVLKGFAVSVHTFKGT
ncbi:MAG: transporter, partial [Thermodesulfobacteriota bacterium]|nr:transporter [Thermodesulfobacteriota bacterium]